MMENPGGESSCNSKVLTKVTVVEFREPATNQIYITSGAASCHNGETNERAGQESIEYAAAEGGAAKSRAPAAAEAQTGPGASGEAEQQKPEEASGVKPRWHFGQKGSQESVENATRENASGGPSEEVLVAAAKSGDAQAFGELIERHRKECLKRAILMIRNRSDAEDEVQNAFWKAFQRLDQFRGDGPFAAWLGRILENQCLMRIREARNSRFAYLDEANESNVRLELVGQSADPEEQVGGEEVIKLLRREISRIPPLLRNAMLLRDLDQMPMPDVAARLRVSVPAAKSRLMRARLELRSRIIKHCGRKGPGTLIQMAHRSSSAYTRAS
jgi:RNA polymerase sigma-70 factor, ECF subfamily